VSAVAALLAVEHLEEQGAAERVGAEDVTGSRRSTGSVLGLSA
jgi:hypothetical protein